jgi:SHS family lactate transporter-like MFS transporter
MREQTPPGAQRGPTGAAWWTEPTRAQWTAFFAAWFAWVLDAFDFTVFLLVMPDIMREFGASKTSTAGSIALTLLVRLVGGITGGWAADRWGRRLPLLIAVLWFAACDAAVAFAPSFAAVVVLRTLFGFGMGAQWTAGATLAMEHWPARSRGLASGVLQGSWAVGYLLAAAVAAQVVPAHGWRALFLAAAGPALLAFPIVLAVKEPRPTGGTRPDIPGFGALMRTPGVLKHLAWGTGVLALGFGAYYGLTALYSTLLTQELGLHIGQVSFHVALFNVGMMAGAIACGLVASRRGAAIAIIVPALAMAASVPLYVGAAPGLLGLGAFLGGLFGAGHSGTTPLLLSSLFPAPLRARGLGIAYQLGAVPAAFVPMGIAALSEAGQIPLGRAMAGVVLACVLGLAGLVALGPEVARRPPTMASDEV